MTFGVFSLHSTMIDFGTPWQRAMWHSRPLFASDVLDRYGHARSLRRVSARRGEVLRVSFDRKVKLSNRNKFGISIMFLVTQ